MEEYQHLSREEIDRIKDVANDPALKTIIDALIHKYIESWRTTSVEQPEQREHLFRMVKCCERLQAEITAISSDDQVTAYNNKSRIKGLN